MITGKKLALDVEDDENWQGNFVKSLKRKDFEVLQATNLKDAEESYSSNSDKIDLIVMDGCLGSDSPNTPDLIKLIRKTFKGPMIASSGSTEYLKILTEAGCDHKFDKGRGIGFRELLDGILVADTNNGEIKISHFRKIKVRHPNQKEYVDRIAYILDFDPKNIKTHEPYYGVALATTTTKPCMIGSYSWNSIWKDIPEATDIELIRLWHHRTFATGQRFKTAEELKKELEKRGFTLKNNGRKDTWKKEKLSESPVEVPQP